MFSFVCVPISGLLKRKGRALLSWKGTTALRLPCYFHHYIPQNNWLNNLMVGWLTDTQLPYGTQLCFVCLGPCTSFYLHHSRFLSVSFTFLPLHHGPILSFHFGMNPSHPPGSIIPSLLFLYPASSFSVWLLHCRLVPSFLMGTIHNLLLYRCVEFWLLL